MERIEILKTYKLYIGGQFPRTESGRYYVAKDVNDKPLANICLSSRKDLRNSVQAARKAFGSWSEKTSFNKAQIIYRIAEMLECRKAQFIDELIKQGFTKSKAEKEVLLSIDRIVYYAGWCDKYQQIFSSINPVSSSHFNFSTFEPMGVVGIIAPNSSSLIGLVSILIPVILSGNTAVILASEKYPLCAISFAEVLNSSDLSGGVVNILTGNENELLSHFASHMDINAIAYLGSSKDNYSKIKELGAENMKRVKRIEDDFLDENSHNPYNILDFVEVKTTWHPIENIGGSTSTY